MNNLKRVLSLGMAGAMLSGMAISANAANFVDQDEIKHTEAVNTLVALDIVNGKENNNFDPKGTVTRAEMAKMITVALNGGKTPVLGTKGTATFSDINEHWAESFIEYCYNLQIIDGMGDGTFAPDAPVTGTQAAKMMLTAIGYDAQVQGYVGADWSLNVNTDANAAGLYADIEGINPNVAMSRDDAAQLIYNGVNAEMMVKTPSKVVSTGEITYVYQPAGYDLLENKFDIARTEAVMVGAFYDADKDMYTYNLDNEDTFKSKEDFSYLFQQNVEVLSHEKSDKVYGIHAKDSKVLAAGIVADLADLEADDTKVKLDGTNCKLDGKAEAIMAYDFLTDDAAALTAVDAADFIEIELIDNDDNGKADVAVVYPVTVAKISFVGSKNLSLNVLAGDPVGAIAIKDADIYKGAAKGDYIMVTDAAYTVDNTTVVEKMNALTGTVEATKSGDQYLIDGTWYTSLVELDRKASYEFIVVNGLVVAAEEVDAEKVAAKYAVVTDVIETPVGFDKLFDTRLMLADGKTADVKATDYVDADTLVSYKVNKDGNYELTALALEGEAPVFADGKIDGTRIAKDALVFVLNSDGDYSVTTGAKLADTKGTVNVAYYETEDSDNGFTYVNLVYVTADKLGKTVETYGYVTGEVVFYEDYATLDLNGKAVKTVDDAEVPALEKGDVVSYTVNADGKIETIAVVELTTAAVIANDGKNMKFLDVNGENEVEGEVTDDTVMIFVDAANNTVEEGDTVLMADEIEEGVYCANVQVMLDGDEIVLLIVDINNDIEGKN